MPVPSSFNDLDTVAANNSPPGTESPKGVVDDYLRAAFAFIKQTHDAAGSAGAARVLGLMGANNSTIPTTKYDLSAATVVLRNASGGMVARHNTGTLTCDLGLAGSVANGRDQAGAFTASSWVYLYFIWNGATLATLASTTAPESFTGASLPTGYTHWAFATALRWNASSNLLRTRTRGSQVWYEIDLASAILADGKATTYTALSLASYIPPNALMVRLQCFLNFTNPSAAPFLASFRPTGSAMSSLGVLGPAVVSGAGSSNYASKDVELPPGSASSVDYKLNAAIGGTGGLQVDVSAYRIPNGGE